MIEDMLDQDQEVFVRPKCEVDDCRNVLGVVAVAAKQRMGEGVHDDGYLAGTCLVDGLVLALLPRTTEMVVPVLKVEASQGFVVSFEVFSRSENRGFLNLLVLSQLVAIGLMVDNVSVTPLEEQSHMSKVGIPELWD